MNEIKAKFIVQGLVQGVGYRFFVYRNATELELRGYSKNLFDGSVEVLVAGTKESIDSLSELLKVGPSRSIVKKVQYEIIEDCKNFNGFEII
jgi:acylphosphatase